MKLSQDYDEYQLSSEEFTSPPLVKESLKDTGSSSDIPDGNAGKRKNRRKWSLLLQVAAISAAVLLIMQSFGIDYFSEDGLFNEAVIFAEGGSREPADDVEPMEPSRIPEENEPGGSQGNSQENSTEDTEESTEKTNESERTETKESDPSEKTDPEDNVETDPEDQSETDPEDQSETDPEDEINEEKETVAGQWTIGKDKSYPTLPNLRPNTKVPNYGTTNEDWIYVDSDAGTGYLYANRTSEKETITIDGLTYDRTLNVLTMDHFSGEQLAVSMMGNSFTIRLIGDNELTGSLILYGNHAGGSVKFTGDGTCKINVEEEEKYGILLDAVNSDSCLMVDRSVTLSVGGSVSAIAADAASTDKMVYYISDKEVPDIYQTAFLSVTEPDTDSQNSEASSDKEYPNWRLTQEDTSAPVTYIEFSPDLGGHASTIPMETALAWREIVTLTKENFWDYLQVEEVSVDSGFEEGLKLAAITYKENVCAHYDNYPHHMFDSDGDIEATVAMTIKDNKSGNTYTEERLVKIYADHLIEYAGTPMMYGSYPTLTPLKGTYESKRGIENPDLTLLSYELLSVKGKVEVWHFPDNLNWEMNDRGEEYLVLISKKGKEHYLSRDNISSFTAAYLGSNWQY